MRGPGAALRFRGAVDRIFDRIEEKPEQFAEHGLVVVQGGAPLFYAVRGAVLPRPFPFIVFFYVRQGVAIVLALAHAKRRPGYWAERR
jgi:hypothetical protein